MNAEVASMDRCGTAATRVLDVAAVSFRYGSQQAGRAWTLEQITLSVGPGEVLGIVGPNGSGKSSLLRVLAGLQVPQQGMVRLDGQELDRLNPRTIARSVALVPQEFAETFPFTVAETVLMGRYPHRRTTWWSLGFDGDTDGDVAWAQQAMEDADVAALAGRMVSDLSGGERQRVMIARALAQNPAILLLDEPTAFLDLSHQAEMGALILRLVRDRQLTVVLVSHDLNVASGLCHRMLLLREGRMVRMGKPAEVIRPDVLRAVYGCDVIVDEHPHAAVPRVTMPAFRG